MRKLEYKEFKKENIKDFFDKVYAEEYTLIIMDGIGNFFFQGGSDLDGERKIEEGNWAYYNYEDFEILIYKFDEYIIDEEEKFIVVVKKNIKEIEHERY